MAEPLAARNRALALELASTMSGSAYGGVHVYGPNRSGRRTLALASIELLQLEHGGARRPFLDLEIRGCARDVRGFLKQFSRRLGRLIAQLPSPPADTVDAIGAIAEEPDLGMCVEYLRDALMALPPEQRPIFGFFDLQTLAHSHAELDPLFGMMREALNQEGVFTFTTANEDQIRSCTGASWFTNNFQRGRPHPVIHADAVCALQKLPQAPNAVLEPDVEQVAESLLRHWGLGETCVSQGMERWRGIRKEADADFDARLESAARDALTKQSADELRNLEAACREALGRADAGLELSNVQRELLERNPWSRFHLRWLPDQVLGAGLEVLGAPLRDAIRLDLLRTALERQAPIEQELADIERSLREGNPEVAHALAKQLVERLPLADGLRRRASLLRDLAEATTSYLARDIERCEGQLQQLLRHLPSAQPFLEELRVAQRMAVQSDWSKAPPERIRCAMIFESARARRLERLARMAESFEADCRVADACASKLLSMRRDAGAQPDDALDAYRRDLLILVPGSKKAEPFSALPDKVHGLSETVLLLRALDPWWRDFDLTPLAPALNRRNATVHRLAYASEVERTVMRNLAQRALNRLIDQTMLDPPGDAHGQGELLPARLIEEVLRSPPPVT
jgi:hypothetical protein